MPPKKGKGPVAPALPVPRDMAADPPVDGFDGALGIDDVYMQERVRRTKANLVEWTLSEAQRAGTGMLELPDSSLDAVPEALADMPWVQALVLSKNALTNACLDQLAGMLPHLKALDLTGNLLSGKLPASLGDLGNSGSSSSGAGAGSSSKDGGPVQGVEELFLDNNMIEALPDEAGKLKALAWLTLRKNVISTLPPPAVASWTALLHLDLRENRLKSLPMEIGACTALEELYLNNNELTELPESLGQCKRLIELHVANNQLTAFPACIAGCADLEVLDVSTNKIASPLPAEVFPTLPSLMVLHVALNKIPALPAEIGACTFLEILNLASTAIKALPDTLAACTNLREIYCNNTPMTTLPAILTSWTKLEAGVWRNAKLKTLPIDEIQVATQTNWGETLAILDVQAKGGKASCKVLEPVRDKLKDARIIGAAWQKPKPKKPGKK